MTRFIKARQRPPGRDIEIDVNSLVSSNISLLGPFSLSFDTPGFFNPEVGNGVETLELPAGAIVFPFAVVTESFGGIETGDQIVLSLADNSSRSGPVLRRYDINGLSAASPDVALHEAWDDLSSSGARVLGLTSVVCKVVAVYWPAGATSITAGSIDVYAFVMPVVQ